MAIPSGRHTDWFFPFSLIPRRWTAFNSKTLPYLILGNAIGHLDITTKGTWALTWPPYFTFRTSNGWHLRTGLRYDYNDAYYEIVPITIKKLE